MSAEIDREISALIALCENFVTQNSQSASVAQGKANSSAKLVSLLGIVSVSYSVLLILVLCGICVAFRLHTVSGVHGKPKRR